MSFTSKCPRMNGPDWDKRKAGKKGQGGLPSGLKDGRENKQPRITVEHVLTSDTNLGEEGEKKAAEGQTRSSYLKACKTKPCRGTKEPGSRIPMIT